MSGIPLFRCKLALALSLQPRLRLFPAALTEPLGGMSLPAVDILADGPGSLMNRGADQDKTKSKMKEEGVGVVNGREILAFIRELKDTSCDLTQKGCLTCYS